jgi:hypothetical protein
MPDEKNKDTAPTKADAQVEPTNPTEEAPTTEPVDDKDPQKPEGDKPKDDGTKGSEVEEPLNYKELLTQERERREKAEKALAKDRYVAKHGKPMPDNYVEPTEPKKPEPIEDPEDDEIDDDDKPLTMKQWKALESKREEALIKKQETLRAGDIVKLYTDNESEAEYVLELFSNRVFPDYMTTEEKVEEAYLIANKGRILSENKELARALKNKDNVNRQAPSVFRKKLADNTIPTMSEQDKAEYARAGFKYVSANKRWEKPLDNGKILVKDPVTKQTSVISK